MSKGNGRPAGRSQHLACPRRPSRAFRPLIVGEAPSRTSDQARPLTGPCGDRLAAFAGLSVAAFRRRFMRMNLLPAWPGIDGPKGARFDLSAARQFADLTRRRIANGRIVILLGKRVAAAFGVRDDYFVAQAINGATIYVVPHPSGVNRWFNAAHHRALMTTFMERISDDRRESN